MRIITPRELDHGGKACLLVWDEDGFFVRKTDDLWFEIPWGRSSIGRSYIIFTLEHGLLLENYYPSPWLDSSYPPLQWITDCHSLGRTWLDWIEKQGLIVESSVNGIARTSFTYQDQIWYPTSASTNCYPAMLIARISLIQGESYPTAIRLSRVVRWMGMSSIWMVSR